MLIEVAVSSHDGYALIQVDGELDIATAPQLSEAISGVASGADLVIDLTATSFIDSSASRVLANARRADPTSPAHVSIVCPPSNRRVRRVLDFLGLPEVVPVYDDVDTAVGSLPA